jgi:hypothetical protein
VPRVGFLLLGLITPPQFSFARCGISGIPRKRLWRESELAGSTAIATTVARTIEVNMIKKVAGGYKVLSEKGKNLGGPYKSKAAAQKRLKQVEYFKHKG